MTNSSPAGDANSAAALRKTLSSVFGYGEFRPNQQEVTSALLAGRDVFGVMATGSGKSLCYQLPAVMLQGTAVVVSPLIALMKDQVDAARANGIAAEFLNSSLNVAARRSVLADLHAGKLKLLYLAPERLAMDHFLETLGSIRLSLFCVDEAHCISEWGHDFRPDYLKVSNITQRFPGVPVAAFTATATHRVQQDIIERLGLRRPFILRASFNRPNLYLEVQRKAKVDGQLAAFVAARRGQSGIIYRRTRSSVETTAAHLQGQGLEAVAYHAGMEDAERTAIQDDFKRDKVRVIVATVAFGMGIDKPDIRYVLHADLPKNIESYYQEIGRAGRDGDAAHCTLFYSPGDIAKARFFVDQAADPVQRQIGAEKLNQMAGYASHNVCRRRQLLAYFGEHLDAENCGGCDICAGTAEQVEATVEAQKLLSAVARTDQRFGASYLADVVTGADTERIRQRGHDRLKTYGVGSDHPRAYWIGLAHDLVAQEILSVEDGQYAVLKLTPAAMEVLSGKRTVTILKRQAPPAAPAVTRSMDELLPYDTLLFERLRAVRMHLARTGHVPPYVVFSDRTLRDMCRKMPANQAQMLAVHGIGEAKFSRYGQDFLSEIARYAPAGGDGSHGGNQPAATPDHTQEKTPVVRPLDAVRSVHARAYEKWSDDEDRTLRNLVATGVTVRQIAQQLERQPSAIRSRIQKLGLE